jgi:predicted dehydrogenase
VDPIYLQARFGFTLNNKTDYRLESAMGGGALLDVGFYVVSIARWILGEPSEVLARSRLRDGTDMTTSALLRFPDGETAAVWASFESAEDQELTVVTRQGAYRLGRPFNWPDEVDQYQLMVESFADSVLHDRPVAIPLSESIANMRVLDRIREAASTR